ncbi:putative cas1 appressorium specific protein [Phaeomoniella chlamydospora]|uniref:Putative cas1 appressorium specific protein n=1 Tax=Phaeomoniella chlamydospora TaxID=158046 RepID=A0A0G2GL02_PHACM|nr:putative cas1 appressorium specific protein [Phaeomoniella chlamydospora]
MVSYINKLLAISLLVASVTAHGKVSVATGDQGGNGTALGIMGAVIPGEGRNRETEVDTTVFDGSNADACGQTDNGDNEVESGVQQAMALSGDTLPQVSQGGSLSGTLHIVTSDGAGPYRAFIDSTGTGDNFSEDNELEVTQQVPGDDGEIRKDDKRFWARALQSVGLMKRASNINEDYTIYLIKQPFNVAIPSDASCTGTVAGQSNVCMVKLVNPSNAGPFGGCVAVQMAANSSATATATTSSNSTTTATKTRKFRKHRA